MARKKPVQFTGTLEKSENKLWGSHVRVPASIAKAFIRGTSRRVIRTLNGSPEHQCGLLPFGKGTFVLSVNKKWRDDLDLDFGSKVSVTLRMDESRYGLPMPDELQELLRQDREANRLFHSLGAGAIRTLLYIIGSAKDPGKRASRASIVVRHLKNNGGKINYRLLTKALQGQRPREPPSIHG
jgi:hypothetical protein